MEISRDVAILIFDDVEVLDFCGPFEVFSVTTREHSLNPFHVHTVAESSRPVVAWNNLSVNPTYTFLYCPQPHILLVPGGYGTRKEMYNKAFGSRIVRDKQSWCCPFAQALSYWQGLVCLRA